MDVVMDNLLDGLETAKKLSKDAATKDIPIILLTSLNEYMDVNAIVDVGYFPKDRWLDKPVKAEKLLEAVGKLIG
jgi:CheY-like chemotaxis protein